MLFEDAYEKKLLQDIQFKRKIVFVDDNSVLNLNIKPFVKTIEKFVLLLFIYFFFFFTIQYYSIFY
jgi:hypothetical protein